MRWERNEFVAGHQFYPAGTCHCNRRWVDIRNTTRAEVGQEGIAHYGKMTLNEYEQIERKRDSEDAAHAAAMSVAVGAVTTAAGAAVDDDWMLFCTRFRDDLSHSRVQFREDPVLTVWRQQLAARGVGP